MSLTSEDRKYFDEKFGNLEHELHEHALKDERAFGLVATTINQAMTSHEEKKHNLGKLFAVLSSIVVVAGAIIAGVLWLIERASR